MYCNSCGHHNDVLAHYCTCCGQQLPVERNPQTSQEMSRTPSSEDPHSSQQITENLVPSDSMRPIQGQERQRSRSILRRVVKWVIISAGVLIGLLIVLVVIGVATDGGDDNQSAALPQEPTPTPIPTPTFDELRTGAAQLSYDDLFRNNERHVGKAVWFEAEVVQIEDARQGKFVLRANVTQGEYFWDDAVYLHYSGPRLLEDDIIEFVRRVEGLKTFRAILGNNVTIPEITEIASRLVE